jgi:hypothetical protein
LIGIVWVVIGLIVASSHAFFVHLNAVTPILSAILAVPLWPLVPVGCQPASELAPPVA